MRTVGKLGQATFVVLLVVSAPAVAGVLLAGSYGAFIGVVASFISFLMSTAVGWHRSARIMPIGVTLSLLAGLLVPGPGWVLLLAAVGFATGYLARYGLLPAGAVLGVALSLAQPVTDPVHALTLVGFGALGATNGVLVGRLLKLPDRIRTDPVGSDVALAQAIGLALVSGAAAWLAATWAVAHAYWLPMTVFLLAMPSAAGHGLTNRTVNRLVGTAAGVGVAFVLLGFGLAPVVYVALGSLSMIAGLAFPVPPWRTAMLTSAALVLVLDSGRTETTVGWERLEATIAAGGLMLLAVAVGLLVQRTALVARGGHQLVMDYADSQFNDN